MCLTLVYSSEFLIQVRKKFPIVIPNCRYQAERQGPWTSCLRIFFVFVNMGPYGSEKFKMLLLTTLQITAESFQTFPEFPSQ